jgi:hypothetical protein
MQDVYPAIADALARPLRTPRGGALYQLWRADFAALGRLSLTCREASMAVRRLLWASTPLGQRELSRRAQVQRARAFMRLPVVASVLLCMTDTIPERCDEYKAYILSRTSVAFNGRIRVRTDKSDVRSPWRQKRRFYRLWLPTCRIGLTFVDQGGRVLIWMCGDDRRPFYTGTFTTFEGAFAGLRGVGDNLNFEPMLSEAHCWGYE